MRIPGRLATLLAACLVLAGCLTYTRSSERSVTEARERGFARADHAAAGFTLASWRRLGDAARPLLVVIEGDGRAWRSRRRPARDPTPGQAIGLQLALASDAANTLYIARPCQFLEPSALRECQQRYWTSARYAAEVVAAVNAVIDQTLRAKGGRARALLLGYSGGGAIAALAAAQRDDVIWLATVAANLDTGAWIRHHGVSPLSGSLNPVQFAAALARVPQVHLAGGRDQRVPAASIRGYLAALGGTAASLHVAPGFAHECCWVRAWPRPLCGALAARGLPAAGLCPGGPSGRGSGYTARRDSTTPPAASGGRNPGTPP